MPTSLDQNLLRMTTSLDQNLLLMPTSLDQNLLRMTNSLDQNFLGSELAPYADFLGSERSDSATDGTEDGWVALCVCMPTLPPAKPYPPPAVTLWLCMYCPLHRHMHCRMHRHMHRGSGFTAVMPHVWAALLFFKPVFVLHHQPIAFDGVCALLSAPLLLSELLFLR